MYKKLFVAVAGFCLFFSVATSAQDLPYVGNSDGTLGLAKGSVGVAALSDLCVDEFGPGARICTSQEVLLNTSTLPVDGNTDLQWVLPTFVSGAFKIFDVSGVEGQPNTLSCLGWRSNSSQGLTVSDEGKFEKKGCGTARQVACCLAAP
ncbi:MAG: hypothetical protein ACREEE_12735 [Dongiaceae bacterium]